MRINPASTNAAEQYQQGQLKTERPPPHRDTDRSPSPNQDSVSISDAARAKAVAASSESPDGGEVKR